MINFNQYPAFLSVRAYNLLARWESNTGTDVQNSDEFRDWFLEFIGGRPLRNMGSKTLAEYCAYAAVMMWIEEPHHYRESNSTRKQRLKNNAKSLFEYHVAGGWIESQNEKVYHCIDKVINNWF